MITRYTTTELQQTLTTDKLSCFNHLSWIFKLFSDAAAYATHKRVILWVILGPLQNFWISGKCLKDLCILGSSGIGSGICSGIGTASASAVALAVAFAVVLAVAFAVVLAVASAVTSAS